MFLRSKSSGRTQRPTSRQYQRGVALLTAIVLVAIAATLAAAIGFSGAMAARRAATQFSSEQGLLAAEGVEAIAAYVLKQSAGNIVTNAQVSLDQAWAQPYGPLELSDGMTLNLAQLEDEQSKFNINNLSSNGSTDPTAVLLFQRLLARVGLEARWAGILADWIDGDDTPNSPDGAEDSTYLSQNPPYRAANISVTSISELMALPGFGRDRYDRLAPYITALPPGTRINICTASGVLLDALSGNTEYGIDPNHLAGERKESGCFPAPAVYASSLTPEMQKEIAGRIGTTSSYFRLRTFITISSSHFCLYSLMHRNAGGQINPILRTFGTE